MVLQAAPSLEALMLNPANKFHALRGDLEGRYAIRINLQWRVGFSWQEGNAHEVKIVDYH